jgi:hypothetical protein
MRLVKANTDGSFGLEWFSEEKAPPYAILSHTWSKDPDDEFKLQDVKDGTCTKKPGFQKLLFCSKQAKHDGLQYFWIDTCSIDQTNLAELSEAINSMYRYYQKAARCYVYLADVSVYTQDRKPHLEWESAIDISRWFTRGWTLQELLAPETVEFFSRDGIRLGDKRSLESRIAKITGIPPDALRGDDLANYSIDDRFSWAEERQTAKQEDKAYCLLGIFGISLSLIYGEGLPNAMRRLRKEIRESETVNPNPIGFIPHKQRAQFH